MIFCLSGVQRRFRACVPPFNSVSLSKILGMSSFLSACWWNRTGGGASSTSVKVHTSIRFSNGFGWTNAKGVPHPWMLKRNPTLKGRRKKWPTRCYTRRLWKPHSCHYYNTSGHHICNRISRTFRRSPIYVTLGSC